MKRLVLLTVALVLATAANLWADDQKPNPSPSGAKAGAGQPAVGWRQTKSGAQWYIESLDPIVGLTDEQKKAITDVIQGRDKMMQEFQSTHAEGLAAASKAISEAYKKNDKEAIAKATKAYQDVYAPFHQAMKESQKKLDEILTSQQREKQLDQQAMMWIKASTAPIELSEEQKQKARAAFREMQKAGNNEGMWRGAPDAILKILTPQQRTALNKSRLLPYMKAMFARVKLTDEQNKKMETLIDKISSDAKLIVDWKAYQDVSRQVEELLTKEQKEMLKKPPQFWGQAGGGVVDANRRAVETLMLGAGGPYWIGLGVEPLDAAQGKKLELPESQGLIVRAVSPNSPAAKAAIKTGDVIVKAGDQTLKSIQDLIQCVQQAKEKDLVLQIIREGKKQKFMVKPAKRPTEGVAVLQVEGDKEKSFPGAKIRQLPGGSFEVIIDQKAEDAQAKALEKLEAARKEFARASLGERVQRQHELAEKAWQAYQKMQKLGDDKKGEAHELLEQIEHVERELRQTFPPAVGGMGLPPGAPVSGWVELSTREAAPAARAAAIERRQAAAIEELRAQVQKLRRDVDDLETRVK